MIRYALVATLFFLWAFFFEIQRVREGKQVKVDTWWPFLFGGAWPAMSVVIVAVYAYRLYTGKTATELLADLQQRRSRRRKQ